MSRLALGLAAFAVVLAAAAGPAHAFDPEAQHTRLVGDVYHTSFRVPLGTGPNAAIRLHRIVRERGPGLPRATRGGVLLQHGDFSSFGSNFAPITLDPEATPGLAVWLAQQGFDVWGVDRRWALPGATDDVSDFGGMGLQQEIDDTQAALAIARTLRVVTGSGGDRLFLIGFSRGGYLAYATAADDGARPAALRNLRGLVPLDVWAEIPPDADDARAGFCEAAFFERAALAEGVVDSDNFFFITLAELAATAPADPSPFRFLGGTNRDALLTVVGQTYGFFPATPFYKLAAGAVEDGQITGLLQSPEAVIVEWLATASPHQSLREAAEVDSLWCGDGTGPFAVDLSKVRVPLLYLGAGGGFGERGLYSTTRVASTDVTVRVIHTDADPFQDFGHGDLLFATAAPTLVWQPLAAWLAAH